MDGLFSDSDEDKAVEELLSQAMDATVLDEVAAINCAGFDDSSLPSHLESRFQKLKSFPSSTQKTVSLSPSKSLNRGNAGNVPARCLKKSPDDKICLSPAKSSDTGGFSPLEKRPHGKMVEKKVMSPSLSSSTSSKSLNGGKAENVGAKGSTKGRDEESFLSPSNSWSFSPLKKNPHGKMGRKGVKTRSLSSSSWEDFSSRSLSPPAKSGCFLCSPKKDSRNKSKENRGGSDLRLDWGKRDDELLSDLSNFSVHGQTKMMKKATEEEEKICKEAEKIVKWAKQASSRMMDVSGIEDDMSDHENDKFPWS